MLWLLVVLTRLARAGQTEDPCQATRLACRPGRNTVRPHILLGRWLAKAIPLTLTPGSRKIVSCDRYLIDVVDVDTFTKVLYIVFPFK